MNKDPRQFNWEVVYHPSSVHKNNGVHSNLTKCFRVMLVMLGILILLYGLSGILR